MRLWLFIAGGAALLGAAALFLYLQPFPPFGYGDRREDEVFSDCPECPDLMPIPAGKAYIGPFSRTDALLASIGLARRPMRQVHIRRAYAIARHEVTFAQWDACVSDGGCNGYIPSDEGWGRGDRPVIHISWDDAQAYVRWLSQKTGEAYRLPTEAEWEYAARAETWTAYSWGKQPDHDYANYGAAPCPPCQGAVEGRDRWINTAPVGQFPPNRFGLHDVHGNVYEWAQDCFVHNPAPGVTDGAAQVTQDCAIRPMRGSAWYSNPERIVSHYRAYNPPTYRDWATGFRVARSM